MTLPESVQDRFEAWKNKQEKKELHIQKPHPQTYQDPYIRLPYTTRFSSSNIERIYQLFDRAIVNSLKNYTKGVYVNFEVTDPTYWTNWYACQCKQNGGERIPYIRINEITQYGSCIIHVLLFGEIDIEEDPWSDLKQFGISSSKIPQWIWNTNGDHPAEYLRNILTNISPESYCFYWVYNVRFLTMSSKFRMYDLDLLDREADE